MEHLCAQCGQTVADGEPFCKNCTAPQIRVVMPGAVDDGSPLDGEPAPPPAAISGRIVFPAGHLPPFAVWKSAFFGGMIATLLMFVLSALTGAGSGFFFFASAFFGGMFAITLLRHYTGASVLRAGQSFRYGALSGLFNWIYLAIDRVVMWCTPASRAELEKAMQAQMANAMASNPDPQARQWLSEMSQFMMTPGGLILVLVIGLVFCMLIAGLGGMLSARFGSQRLSR